MSVFVHSTAATMAVRPTVDNCMDNAFVTTFSNVMYPAVTPLMLDLAWMIQDPTSIISAVLSWQTAPSSLEVFGNALPSLMLVSSAPLYYGNLWPFSRHLMNTWCTTPKAVCTTGRPPGFAHLVAERMARGNPTVVVAGNERP